MASAVPDGHAELTMLRRLDEASQRLQEEGKYLEALECMERGLVVRQHLFGADSEEVWGACRSVGELCNMLAMSYLQQEDFDMVTELLKKAEILTERDAAGRAVTYNNLACYYRRVGRLHAALKFLKKALSIEARLERVTNPADTHLNICAVLSQLSRHAEALRHAQAALRLINHELFGASDAAGGGAVPAQKADRIAVLCITYHNLGAENEHLRRWEDSLQAYGQGIDTAGLYLGEDHGISQTLRKSYRAAAKAMAKAQGHRMGVGGPAQPKTRRAKTLPRVAAKDPASSKQPEPEASGPSSTAAQARARAREEADKPAEPASATTPRAGAQAATAPPRRLPSISGASAHTPEVSKAPESPDALDSLSADARSPEPLAEASADDEYDDDDDYADEDEDGEVSRAGDDAIGGALVVRAVTLQGTGGRMQSASLRLGVGTADGGSVRFFSQTAETAVDGGSVVWKLDPLVACSLAAFGSGEETCLVVEASGKTTAGSTKRGMGMMLLDEALLVGGEALSERVVPVTTLRIGARVVVEVAFLADASPDEAVRAVMGGLTGLEAKPGEPAAADDYDDAGEWDDAEPEAPKELPKAAAETRRRMEEAQALLPAASSDPAKLPIVLPPSGASAESSPPSGDSLPRCLTMFVERCEGLHGPDGSFAGRFNPYVTACVVGPDGKALGPVGATRSVANADSPSWNESIRVRLPAGAPRTGLSVVLTVSDEDGVSARDHLGSVTIPLMAREAGAEAAVAAGASMEMPDEEQPAARMWASGRWEAECKPPSTVGLPDGGSSPRCLTMFVERCEGLHGPDGSFAGRFNPYVTACVVGPDGKALGPVGATRSVANADSPSWNESIRVRLPAGAPRTGLSVVLTVSDEDGVSARDHLGSVTIPLMAREAGAEAAVAAGASMEMPDEEQPAARMWASGRWEAECKPPSTVWLPDGGRLRGA
ncbi:hypothetical protein FNF27_07604 [Cafeteria roenbergensis]|uniref:C2 domain-containing protein n=1 Tax=Cafeteria roenbergensis TaxID=33653 RepID=A0A5A8DKN8_CAFRO|nr:hypothetical protein FNF27_07604 [Cafeteria roenbergensis]